MKLILLAIVFSFFSIQTYAQMNKLRSEIEQYIKPKDAKIGVALYHLDTGDTLTIGNDKRYPMQSVYKFHLALAVLAQIDKGRLGLDQKIFVEKADLLPDTWSPMREKYPNGNIEVPLSEILNFTISQSDNNGCDILFRLIGGTEKVHQYIKKLGIKNVAIKATEEEMHKEWDVQYTNWTTPFSVVELLHRYYKGGILTANSFEFLWKAMVETTTGPKRIKGLLPVETVVGHKTGTSGTNKEGITSAINDVGIIKLPNGQALAIVVLVSDSKENDETNQKIIAEITKMVWDYYTL